MSQGLDDKGLQQGLAWDRVLSGCLDEKEEEKGAPRTAANAGGDRGGGFVVVTKGSKSLRPMGYNSGYGNGGGAPSGGSGGLSVVVDGLGVHHNLRVRIFAKGRAVIEVVVLVCKQLGS
jgi:hypothetical protein